MLSASRHYQFDASDEELLVKQERIAHILDELKLNHKIQPSQFIDTADIADMFDMMVLVIYDREGDKMGRLHDLIDGQFERFARWLVDSPNTSVTIPMKQKLGVL